MEKFTEKTLSVPIEVLNLPDSLSLKTFPHVVQVTCQVGLSNFEKLQPSMFSVVVDYKEAIGGQSKKLRVDLVRQPDFIQSVKFSPRSLNISLKSDA